MVKIGDTVNVIINQPLSDIDGCVPWWMPKTHLFDAVVTNVLSNDGIVAVVNYHPESRLEGVIPRGRSDEKNPDIFWVER